MSSKKSSAPKRPKAPPPIRPLDPKPLSFETAGAAVAPETVNWKYWKNVATVELWQALLLSLDIEPPGGGLLIRNSPNASMGIPSGYLDSIGKTKVFNERWHLLRNKLETAYAASGFPPQIDDHTFITLTVFAVIAIEFEWNPLPPELARLAMERHDSHSKATKAKTYAEPELSGQEGARSIDTKPRIGWKVAMLDAWPDMRKTYGREPGAIDAISYLIKHDPGNCVSTKQDDGGGGFYWCPDRARIPKLVTKKTVQNTISVWKKKGMVPA